MSSPSTNAGVHRRRPSVLVATPSSMDVPGLSSNPSEPTPSLLSNSSSGSIHQMTASPQTYTPTAAATGGGGGSSATSRRRRASSSNEPSAAGEGAGSGSTAGSRGKKSGRRSTGHSEHPSPGPQAHHLSTPAEGVDSPSAPSVVTDAAAAVGSSSLAPASHPHQQQQQQPQPLNPYAPPPTQPQPASHSSSGGSTSPYGQFGHGPTLRTLPASSARKAPPLRTISSSSSTAIHYPASPTRSARADDLVPISPGSGFLPSHSGGGGGAASLAGQSLLYGSSAADGSSAGLPPYSVNPTASSSSSHSLGQLLPSLPLPASSGFNTAFQTAQTSPTLAVSLQMEGGAAYGGQSRFFGSNPSSPGPSSPTTSEPEEHDHGHGAGSYGAYYPPSTTLEKLLPSKDDVREKASEWRRWWKRRNSRSYSTGRPGASGILSSAGSVADRKKRRRRAGSGVGGSVGGPGGGRKWWRRFRPERKRGWLLASVVGILCLWSFVHWMFWVFNPDKARIEYRPECISPYPSYHALSTLSPDTLQRIPLPSVGSPLHPLLPEPLLAPSSVESDALAPAGVFVGVFSTDQAFERRMLIRSTWASGDVWRGKQGEGLASTRVRFILGMPRGKWKELVRTEMETYGDIVILEVHENMNSGKTHDYFSWASDNAMVPAGGAPGEAGEKKPEFVVKSDDDSFLMLGELEKRLRVLRGRKVYWGYLIKNLFMGGECYALSLDLVHYVATSAPVRQLIRGAEDKLVARWMRMHPEKETILWASESCWMYDHPRAGTVYSHGFLYPATAREIQAELLTLDGGEVTTDGSAAAARPNKGRKKADSLSYTSVAQFGTAYRPPLPNLTPLQRVEALIEGSEMSLLSPYSSVPDTSPLLPETVMARRPSINDRYLGQWEAGRWGAGTVVVHYVKEREWFLETALAFERLGGGMGNEDYQVREGRKVETVHEVQHVAGVDAHVEDSSSLWKRAAADVPTDSAETVVGSDAQDPEPKP